MKDILALVEENTYISGRLYLLKVLAPEIAKDIKAGHFVMVKVSNSLDPMGRRAFAVADVRGDSLLIFYDLVGRGTKILSELKKGERLWILGPLGKGLFSYEGDRHLLLGGGVGLAGLTLLGKELRNMGKKVLFVYAGRSKEHLGMEDWLKEEGFDYILYTEDGSKGKKGLITDVLKEFDTSWIVHACGPKAMLRALKKMKTGHRMYFSLESRMACGWGVCLGCVVQTKEGYKRVCYEGPVFSSEEVIF
ncbi:MAG: dihydroorotate dehydrogenase electron transfer subunit [Aquificota bacterium]|nr:dihydroorotate dehydrogenase electron transfer subunit [Aquificaceae bacterium]MDM7266310.1 dihydroorotate dehydrogenase electron transfer subunit [Aquificaceae bacterium]QWK13299.1 MAG: dihydroorotate dehydrogenase electron transfer subunit [Aquificota bacterium]HCO39645.1 dihydroorotate dehydrogenase [Aquificaceae bacterium]